MASFTSPVGLKLTDPTCLNELIAAYNERAALSGYPSPFDDGSDGNPITLEMLTSKDDVLAGWAWLQQLVLNLAQYFVDPNTDFEGLDISSGGADDDGVTAYPLCWQDENADGSPNFDRLFQAALGDGYPDATGFRQYNSQADVDADTPDYGLATGSVVGPWIIQDLQAVLLQYRWLAVLINRGSDEQQVYGSAGAINSPDDTEALDNNWMGSDGQGMGIEFDYIAPVAIDQPPAPPAPQYTPGSGTIINAFGSATITKATLYGSNPTLYLPDQAMPMDVYILVTTPEGLTFYAFDNQVDGNDITDDEDGLLAALETVDYDGSGAVDIDYQGNDEVPDFPESDGNYGYAAQLLGVLRADDLLDYDGSDDDG